MPWYLPPIPQQKQLGATIHRLQNGGVLTVGPLGAINFESAADVSVANRN